MNCLQNPHFTICERSNFTLTPSMRQHRWFSGLLNLWTDEGVEVGPGAHPRYPVEAVDPHAELPEG